MIQYFLWLLLWKGEIICFPVFWAGLFVSLLPWLTFLVWHNYSHDTIYDYVYEHSFESCCPVISENCYILSVKLKHIKKQKFGAERSGEKIRKRQLLTSCAQKIGTLHPEWLPSFCQNWLITNRINFSGLKICFLKYWNKYMQIISLLQTANCLLVFEIW